MRICIASPALDVYSETFIRAHVEQLPFHISTLSGSRLDLAESGSILKESFNERILNYPSRKLGHFRESDFVSNRQAAWLRREGVQAVLAEYGFTGVAIASACAKAGVPLIVHFHGFDAHNNDAVDPCRESYARMFDQASAVVVVSTPMFERLVELGCPRERIRRVPYFVDPLGFSAAAPASAGNLFLSVGRFVEKKAPHLTLLAFHGVLGSMPDARLEMAGDGPLLGAAKWLARALGIEQSVIFHGSKSHEWVALAMQRARAFVQHSVRAENGDSEGMPVAILEAQCAGLPVIATRHAGIPEVVVHGQTGFLCEEGDVRQMTEHMIQVLRMDAAETNEMSRAARRRILTAFCQEQTLDKLAEVIRTAAL